MIPIFLQMTELHLYNSRLAVFIVYVGAGLPIGIFLCTEYIRGIPSALIESARIDGAGYFLIFRRVILPLTRPVATTLAILDITSIWNEFCLINILVSKTELKSMPLGILKFSGALSSDFGKEFAALCIGMLPMLVFYLVFRKWITRGVAAGAVKG
jgi:raffinose/stachyose/melibiose transport system permease protein